MAAIGEVGGQAAATVMSLMREGGASIVVGSMAGVLTWCGIKIFWIRLGVGRYSHTITPVCRTIGGSFRAVAAPPIFGMFRTFGAN